MQCSVEGVQNLLTPPAPPHPFSLLFVLVSVKGELEPTPADFGLEAWYTLDCRFANHGAHKKITLKLKKNSSHTHATISMEEKPVNYFMS